MITDNKRTFTYSAKASGSVIEITDIQTHCGFKQRKRFEGNADCDICGYEDYSRCGGVKTLMELETYMSSYNNSVKIKSPLILY